MLESLGLLATPTSAKTAAITLADGVYTMQAISDLLAAATGGSANDIKLFTMLGNGQGRRLRSITWMLASTEANNATVKLRARLLRGAPGLNPFDLTSVVRVGYLGEFTYTIGSGVGVSGGFVSDSERIADTVTFSGTTLAALIATKNETETIGNLLYSPADQTPALATIADCDNAAAILWEVINATSGKATKVVTEVGS